MGSLNGDVMVIRNGRSTSQVSVYNYPEHLNPFYEDDQHKRLRFWQLSKKHGSEGRRNSFSISNLKDMWAFKSFRSKKKSSMLGINKTSESPPPLRRDFYAGPSPSDNAFQRNGFYRSSLQNVTHTQDEFSFAARQNNYRRTMQGAMAAPSPGNRYGSLTPQSYHKPVRNNGDLSRGSSQLSVASTNPFDTDDDECNDDVDDTHRRTSLSTNGVQKTPRKKRRAPLPPSFVHQSTPNSKTSQNANSLQNEQDLNISNLSAQIQSFVESSTNDSELAPTTTPEASASSSRTTTTPEKKPQATTTTTTTTAIELETPVPTRRAKTLEIVEHVTDSSSDELNKRTEIKILNNNKSEEIVVQMPTEKVNKINETPAEIEKPPQYQEQNGKINKTTEIKVVQREPLPVKTIKTQQNGQITQKQQQQQRTETITIATSSTTTPPSLPPKQHKQQQQTEQIRNEKSQTTSSNHEAAPTPRQDATEIGHVECIHVHLNSPTLANRKSDEQHVSSFRAPDSQPQSILKSPKMEGKRENKIKFSDEENIDELRINEEQSVVGPPKPAIRAKPQILVQTKLITENNNSNNTKRPQEFSTIHKPHRQMQRVEETTTTTTTTTTSATSPAPVQAVELADSKQPSISVETKPLNKTNNSQIVVVDINHNTAAAGAAAAPKPTEEERLKIVESKEDILKEDGGPSVASEGNDNSLYRRFPNTTTHRDIFDWKQSTLAPLEPVPPEKRKSVKDIIESINRSQRLLNASAQKSQPNFALETTTTDVNTNGHLYLQQQPEQPQQESDDGAAASSYTQHHKDPLKIDNSEILKKFEIRKEVYDFRESSPTASNLDWNPVPKPKRTKNFSDC